MSDTYTREMFKGLRLEIESLKKKIDGIDNDDWRRHYPLKDVVAYSKKCYKEIEEMTQEDRFHEVDMGDGDVEMIDMAEYRRPDEDGFIDYMMGK